MNDRYALYLAPPADSALWRFGSRVLGRDAVSGERLPGFAPPGYEGAEWAEVTAQARRYGFHATLKAPFRLAEGATGSDLVRAVSALANAFAPFDLPLTVGRIPASADRAFVALRPRGRSAELESLEACAVRDLDPFRAPPTPQEIARRRPETLTPRQRAYLQTWGYPYVREEFRLHFTLSGPVGGAETLAAALEREADASALAGFRVDALALFTQSGGEDFLLRERFPLGAGQPE